MCGGDCIGSKLSLCWEIATGAGCLFPLAMLTALLRWQVDQYTKEDLDVWNFALTEQDMVALNAIGGAQ